MKKHLSVLVAVALLVVSICAVFAADLEKQDPELGLIKFSEEFCKIVSKIPLIAVCVAGDPQQTAFTKGTERALKTRTQKLLEKYSKSAKAPVRKFLSTCSYMDWVPAECGGAATFCTANPTNTMCPSPCDFDNWHSGYCGGASYCTLHPGDGRCPSTCTYMDWHDPYCGAATFCTAHPDDTICPSPCSFTEWHSGYCGGASYCSLHTNDDRCPSSCMYPMAWHQTYCCNLTPTAPQCQ